MGQIDANLGSQYICRATVEAFSAQCIVPIVMHGGGSIMVRGCISATRVSELSVCREQTIRAHYMPMREEVLELSILILLQDERLNVSFQKQATIQWLQSLSFSPIEHALEIVNTNLGKHHCAPKEVLRQYIFEKCETVSLALRSDPLSSMSKRIKNAICAGDGDRKYFFNTILLKIHLSSWGNTGGKILGSLT